MPNKAFVRLYYAQNEEVLETGAWYSNNISGLTIDPFPHQLLAEDVFADVAANDDIFPESWKCLACEVSVPKTEALPYGPFRYIYTSYTFSNAVVASIGDLATAIVKFSGSNDDQQPVTGGLRISGIPTDTVDCNTLTSAFVTQLETFVDAVFPANRSTSDGTDWVRVIKSTTGGGGAGGFWNAPNRSISPLVGTRLDRVANRTQGKSCPVI